MLAAVLAALSIPAQAWVAAGPRGVAHGYGGSGVAYGRYGGTAAWSHGGYYHPPMAYHGGYYYGGGYSGGQVAGAAVAGLAGGAMAGAAVASSQSSPPPPQSTTVIVQEQAPAYSQQLPIGTQLSALPGNCGNATLHGVEYYICGQNWLRPYFGSSSVYYQVVSQP